MRIFYNKKGLPTTAGSPLCPSSVYRTAANWPNSLRTLSYRGRRTTSFVRSTKPRISYFEGFKCLETILSFRSSVKVDVTLFLPVICVMGLISVVFIFTRFIIHQYKQYSTKNLKKLESLTNMGLDKEQKKNIESKMEDTDCSLTL